MFRFVSFRFVSFRFVSFRFVSLWFGLFCSVSNEPVLRLFSPAPSAEYANLARLDVVQEAMHLPHLYTGCIL